MIQLVTDSASMLPDVVRRRRPAALGHPEGDVIRTRTCPGERSLLRR